jgi:hypothetical protein
MRDLIVRMLGHYPIVDTIGEGGMGEVHRVVIPSAKVKP